MRLRRRTGRTWRNKLLRLLAQLSESMGPRTIVAWAGLGISEAAGSVTLFDEEDVCKLAYLSGQAAEWTEKQEQQPGEQAKQPALEQGSDQGTALNVP